MASYSDQQLLELYRNALGAIASGQSYTIDGRTLTRASLKTVWDTIVILEKRVAAATGDTTGTGIALLTFNN